MFARFACADYPLLLTGAASLARGPPAIPCTLRNFRATCPTRAVRPPDGGSALAPGRRRRGGGTGEIELGAEEAAGAPQLVGEHPPGDDLDRPDVGDRSRRIGADEQVARGLIGGEHLAARVAGPGAVAAIAAHRLLAAVGSAMDAGQPESPRSAGD